MDIRDKKITSVVDNMSLTISKKVQRKFVIKIG